MRRKWMKNKYMKIVAENFQKHNSKTSKKKREEKGVELYHMQTVKNK